MTTHSLANGINSTKGHSNIDEVFSLCHQYVDKGFIKSVHKNYCALYDKASSDKTIGYTVHIWLETTKGSIGIFTACSYRSDRFKANIFRANGVRHHSVEKDSLYKIFFVMKFSEDNAKFIKKLNSEVDNNPYLGIDHGFLFQDLDAYLEGESNV